MAAGTVPVIRYPDLLSTDDAIQRQAIQQLGIALEEIGFFILDHTTVSPEVIRRAYQTATCFFALPESVKGQYDTLATQGLGGFSRFASEQAKGYPVPDLKEFWHVNYFSLTTSQAPWPSEVPAFRPIMSRLYEQLAACADVLLGACATYLNQPCEWLREMARGGNTVLRLAHYPPLPANAPPGSLRAAPHEDINLITLLCEATQPGLEILTRDGQWLSVQATPGQIVVDTGDMLQYLTNGLLKSTTHRVSNPRQDHETRLSMPFFVHPRGEVDLTPGPEFVQRTGGVSRFAPITAGDYLNQRLQAIQVQ